MRRLALRAPAVLLLTGRSLLLAQAVEGTVVNSASGTPLGGVAVTIMSRGQGTYNSVTDSQGAFRIDGIKPGSYTANFSKAEFLPLEQNAPARRPFNVAAGADPVRLQAALLPYGKVSGRVLDANGDPIPGVEVLLDTSRVGLTKTSDKEGNFSFPAAPGRYTLSARPPSTLKPPPAAPDERLGWVPTFYPGTLDSRAAAKIVVRGGVEMWGQDIRLLTAPLRRVRGVLLDAKGDPAPHAAVSAARTDEALTEDFATASAEDGSFELSSLYDGEWDIFAQAESNGVKFMGSAAVQVAGRDVDGLELRLKPPFTLRGSVSLAGTEKPAAKIGIFLKPPVVGGEHALSQGYTEPDGAFKIDNVYPGMYKIIANTPGAPYFLSAIAIGERDVLGQFVELDSSSLPLRVVFESKGGGVRGTVADCANATIVLMPEDRSLREPQLVRTGKCGEDGHFEIANLRPGGYFAFAFDRWDGPMELFSSLDQALLNQAVGVGVRQDEFATVELRVTTRGQ